MSSYSYSRSTKSIYFKQLIAESEKFDVLLFADEEDAKSGDPHQDCRPSKNVYHEQTVLVVFGPEGGCLEQKRRHFVQQVFFRLR